MELVTSRLRLRPFTFEDVDSTHKYVSDAESIRYMLYFPTRSLNETREFLTRSIGEWAKPNPEFYEFVIELNHQNIGEVSVYLNNSRTQGELGWLIHRDFQNNGYVTEAAEAIKYFSINMLQLERLYACCDSRNIASRRIMEKIGLKLESSNGTRINCDGCQATELIYSLTV